MLNTKHSYWQNLATSQLPETMQLAQWLKVASHSLAQYDSAKLDADLLMCHVLGCARTNLYAWPEKQLSTDELDRLNALLNRRIQGEPIAYLVRQREFWSLEFDVNEAVLVPRADTELIVDLALQALPMKHNEPIIDAGTGSGAIATALSYQWMSDAKTPSHAALNMVASDYSVAALTLAKRNAIKHGLEHIKFVRSNWLQAFADNTFGMIVSNPPYLANSDRHLENKTLQYEPISALVSGDDGLDDIRTLIIDACRAGLAECYVLLEHGATQANDVTALMHAANYTGVQTHQDIAGLDRVTCGYCPTH